MALLCFHTYNKGPKVGVVSQLTEYLKRIKCFKHYRVASKDTISRWCKSIVKENGISIHSYTSHSSIAPASSYARSRGALLSTIIQSAGWKSERTFVRFYDKQIQEEVEFQNYLLQEN